MKLVQAKPVAIIEFDKNQTEVEFDVAKWLIV